jgi:hypothetical protein
MVTQFIITVVIKLQILGAMGLKARLDKGALAPMNGMK